MQLEENIKRYTYTHRVRDDFGTIKIAEHKQFYMRIYMHRAVCISIQVIASIKWKWLKIVLWNQTEEHQVWYLFKFG